VLDPWPATAGASGDPTGSTACDLAEWSAAREASAAGDFAAGLASVQLGSAAFAQLVLAFDRPGLESAPLDLAFDLAEAAAFGPPVLARGSSDPAFGQPGPALDPLDPAFDPPGPASEPLAFGPELGLAFDWVLGTASVLPGPEFDSQLAALLKFKQRI
jgi:hypothetical protein